MPKLLVDNPQGIQEIILVGEGGAYIPAEPDRTLWDERIHGPMNLSSIQAQLGSWKRDAQGALVQDAARKSVHDTAVSAQAVYKSDLDTKKQNSKAIIKSAKSVNTLPELKALLVAIVDLMGLDQ